MKKSGFTLIELLLVIALLAIVSTLAVTRIGNLRASAARKVSVANMQAAGRAIDAFTGAAAQPLDRLDSLVYEDSTSTAAGFGDFGAKDALYAGPTDVGSPLPEAVAAKNSGLAPALRETLCGYSLSKSEAAALHAFGLRHVRQFAKNAEVDKNRAGDDGSFPVYGDGLDPEGAACIVRNVTNDMVVAAVTGITDPGRQIYRECGAELPADESDGSYDAAKARAEIAAAGGPLLAFGLGDGATIIGKAGGIESAPFSEVPDRRYYRDYVVLVRLRTAGGETTAEFAGILDPEGRTISRARAFIE